MSGRVSTRQIAHPAAVTGLVAIIHVKLNGVSTSASHRPATAEMLTDSAVLPPPMCVIRC